MSWLQKLFADAGPPATPPDTPGPPGAAQLPGDLAPLGPLRGAIHPRSVAPLGDRLAGLRAAAAIARAAEVPDGELLRARLRLHEEPLENVVATWGECFPTTRVALAGTRVRLAPIYAAVVRALLDRRADPEAVPGSTADHLLYRMATRTAREYLGPPPAPRPGGPEDGDPDRALFAAAGALLDADDALFAGDAAGAAAALRRLGDPELPAVTRCRDALARGLRRAGHPVDPPGEPPGPPEPGDGAFNRLRALDHAWWLFAAEGAAAATAQVSRVDPEAFTDPARLADHRALRIRARLDAGDTADARRRIGLAVAATDPAAAGGREALARLTVEAVLVALLDGDRDRLVAWHAGTDRRVELPAAETEEPPGILRGVFVERILEIGRGPVSRGPFRPSVASEGRVDRGGAVPALLDLRLVGLRALIGRALRPRGLTPKAEADAAARVAAAVGDDPLLAGVIDPDRAGAPGYAALAARIRRALERVRDRPRVRRRPPPRRAPRTADGDLDAAGDLWRRWMALERTPATVREGLARIGLTPRVDGDPETPPARWPPDDLRWRDGLGWCSRRLDLPLGVHRDAEVPMDLVPSARAAYVDRGPLRWREFFAAGGEADLGSAHAAPLDRAPARRVTAREAARLLRALGLRAPSADELHAAATPPTGGPRAGAPRTPAGARPHPVWLRDGPVATWLPPSGDPPASSDFRRRRVRPALGVEAALARVLGRAPTPRRTRRLRDRVDLRTRP